jgi:hypothetical protein
MLHRDRIDIRREGVAPFKVLRVPLLSGFRPGLFALAPSQESIAWWTRPSVGVLELVLLHASSAAVADKEEACRCMGTLGTLGGYGWGTGAKMQENQ